MSCQESVNYGYGFPIEEITNIDLVKAILEESFQDEMMKERVRNTQANDMYELITNIEVEYMHDESISMILANWMSCNEMCNPRVIRFDGYHSDGECDTQETIMFSLGYPWQCTAEERCLTQDELHEILCKFANLFGMKERHIDYQELHYYG